MSAEIQLLLLWLAFAGSHTLLSHPPVRAALVGRLGNKPFLLLYSLIAFAIFIPLVSSYFSARSGAAMPLVQVAVVPGLHWLTLLLMLVALLLMALALSAPNPVSPLTGSSVAARGALRITRHPLFMGAALWGLAHLLILHSTLDRIFFGGVLLYSLLGAAHQDWRRRTQDGERLRQFYADTSFFPLVAIARGRNRFVAAELSRVALVAGLVVYILLFVFHHRWFAG